MGLSKQIRENLLLPKTSPRTKLSFKSTTTSHIIQAKKAALECQDFLKTDKYRRKHIFFQRNQFRKFWSYVSEIHSGIRSCEDEALDLALIRRKRASGETSFKHRLKKISFASQECLPKYCTLDPVINTRGGL